MPYLEDKIQGQIVGICQAGLPFCQIGMLVGISLKKVHDTVEKYQHLGTVKTQKKTSRPSILKDQDWQQLNRLITQCWHLTVAQVTNLLTKLFSTGTIQHEVHKLGKSSRIALKKPFL
ncbi:hypothetical protein O181_015536 [Austropuccinia psidii MF-1]|uniref:Paired domain-containing protein n=1 Tax=Austropuccinia psidii MF-1 TaxID=1389203 RepID=A0A9Q3C3Y1_9BASI|nr:hypothetical protein [Austropuccinia psidii MF-1]